MAAAVLLLAACGGDGAAISELLLRPDDFPGLAVTQTDLQVGESAEGQPIGQVELAGAQFGLIHSLVLFASAEQARSFLAGIEADRLAQGITPGRLAGFGERSLLLPDDPGGERALTLFFVQDRALVRLSLSGPQREELMPAYAGKARDRARRQ